MQGKRDPLRSPSPTPRSKQSKLQSCIILLKTSSSRIWRTSKVVIPQLPRATSSHSSTPRKSFFPHLHSGLTEAPIVTTGSCPPWGFLRRICLLYHTPYVKKGYENQPALPAKSVQLPTPSQQYVLQTLWNLLVALHCICLSASTCYWEDQPWVLPAVASRALNIKKQR